MKLDWTKVTTSLGLKGSTANALTAFKKRNDDARRRVQQLSEMPQTVNFQQYRSNLRNQAIVDEMEKTVNGYQVKKVDINRQLKAIESFESQAIKSAEETKGVVERELKELDKTLRNIEEARPFEDLTVVSRWLHSSFSTASGEMGNRTDLRIAMLGRSRQCETGDRQANRAARFQGPLACARVQGMSLHA